MRAGVMLSPPPTTDLGRQDRECILLILSWAKGVPTSPVMNRAGCVYQGRGMW